MGHATDPLQAAEREFQTSFAETPQTFVPFLDRLVIVRRLREVRALDAFTRIDAPPDILLEDDEAMQHVRRQILGRGVNEWRPAVELLGDVARRIATLREKMRSQPTARRIVRAGTHSVRSR